MVTTNSAEFNQPALQFRSHCDVLRLMAHTSTITAVITKGINTDSQQLTTSTIVLTVPGAVYKNHISVIAVAHSPYGFTTVSLTSSWSDSPIVETTSDGKPIDVIAKFMKMALIGNNELIDSSEECLQKRTTEFLSNLLSVSV